MGIGSGLQGSLGLAPETTYGTYVAATRHLEVENAKLKKIKNTMTSKGLAGGRAISLGSRRQVTSLAASGSISLEVANTQMGVLFNNAIGGTVTPVQQGATTAYLQTHSLAVSTNNFGKSLSLQTGIADVGGTSRPYTFLGGKITKFDLSCGIDDYLKMTADIDCRDVVESQTLVAPSYAAGTRSFHWDQGAVKISDLGGSPASIDGVRKLSLNCERKMDTGRFYFGVGGLKAEPILNDFTSITGSLDADLILKADLADRYRDDTPFALVWEFVGPLIASTYYETFRVTLPDCFFDDAGPTLDGPDLAKLPMKFTALYDGTNPPMKIEIISIDMAI
jgi:hypothetical protein